MSLRNRIALYYVFATGLLVVVVFFVLYTVMYRTVYGHMDDDLDAESLEVFHGIVVLNNEIVFANPDEWSEQEHGQVEVNPIFLQVVDTAGHVLQRTPNLRDTLLAFDASLKQKTFFDTMFLNAPVRQVQLPIPNPLGRTLGYVVVAMPRKEAEMILSNLRIVLFTALPIVLILVFAASRLIAGRSIAPIETVTATAERITSHHLDERIELPQTRDELNRLASTINGLLDRLEDALLRERHFTADASHELRTPLAALKGTLEVLIRKPRTQERYVEKIAYCISEVDRLSHLVDQLLFLARYDSGTMKPSQQEVDLQESVTSLVERMKPLFVAERVKVCLHSAHHILVRADPLMVDMILENILSNAIKYSSKDSSLDISVAQTTRTVECTITDHGIGMSEDLVPKIFDRFYRIDESRNSDVKGAGLGLAIVKRLADLQGLLLVVKSELNKGTSVSLIFPEVGNG